MPADPIAVVGAGPAGSITALVLARAGIAVDLIDTHHFPRVKACGDVLGSTSTTLLHELGLTEVLHGAQRLVGIRHLDTDGRTLSAEPMEPEHPGAPVVLSRERFDAALHRLAVDAGARAVRARFTGLDHTNDGIRIHLEQPDGSPTVSRHRFLVGADGARSAVARVTGLHPDRGGDHALSIRRYVPAPPNLDPELLFLLPPDHDPDRFGPAYHWAFPVDAHRWNIGVYACNPVAGRKLRSELDALHDRLVDRYGFGPRGLTEDEVLGGIVRYDFDPAQLARDRVALVGDAAGLSNAILGEGIAHALGSGRTVGETLAELGPDAPPETLSAAIVERLEAEFGSAVSHGRRQARDGLGIFDTHSGYGSATGQPPTDEPASLVDRIVTALDRGTPPFAHPAPSTPRLLPVFPTRSADGTVLEARSSLDRAGLWWRSWETTRVLPAPDLQIAPLPRGRALAARPGRRTLLLHDLHLLLLRSRDAHGTVIAQVADELRTAGAPSQPPAEILLANAALALVDDGLVTLEPAPSDPPPSIDHHLAPEPAPRSVRLRPGLDRPEDFRPLLFTPQPGGSVSEGEPSTGVLHDLWVHETPHGATLYPELAGQTVPENATWFETVLLDADGSTVHLATGDSPARARHLLGIVFPERFGDPLVRSAETADLLRVGPSGGAAALELAARLAAMNRLVSAPETSSAPLRPPPSVLAVADDGDLELLGQSAKFDARGSHPHRPTWWLRSPTDPAGRRRTATLLRAFGLPEALGRLLTRLDHHDGRLIVGAEAATSGERRKVYLPVDHADTWDTVLAHLPDLGRLHESSAISTGPPGDAVPSFVAWKYHVPSGGITEPTGLTTAVYRSRHDQGLTAADAIRAVLPNHPAYAESAIALLAHDRDPDARLSPDDVEVIDDRGRRSIDLAISDSRPTGHRIDATLRLIAPDGNPTPDAHRFAQLLGRVTLTRFITGIDGNGEPFLSIYTDQGHGR